MIFRLFHKIQTSLIMIGLALVWVSGDVQVSGAVESRVVTQPSIQTDKGSPITLVHSLDYKPLCYVDKFGVSKGVLIDYWTLWSQKAGIPIQFEAILWHKCLERARTDQNVIIPGIFYTPERDSFLDFSQSFMDIKACLFARKSIKVENLTDIKGKIVGVTLDDRVESFLSENVPTSQLKIYEGFENVIKAAAEGEIDIFAMDHLCAEYYLHKYNASEDFNMVRTLYAGKFCAGVKDGNQSLLMQINGGIEQIKREEIDNILEKWLSRSELMPKWVVKLLLSIAAGIIAVTIFTSLIILKIQVRNRTFELNRKNNELQESEEKYRNLVERANDGIAIIQDRRLKFVNQRLTEIIGYNVDEIIGTEFDKYIHPRELSKINDLYQFRMAGESVPTRYECVVKHKNGTDITIEINAGIISYDGKNANLVFVSDISEQKKADEEKRKMEARLQRARKMEAIGTLAGGVAHDLNNVLSGIVSYPDLLLMQLPENTPLRKPISIIKESGNKAAAIVQDLLTLARRGVAEMEAVNLNQIISGYLNSPEFDKLIEFHPDISIENELEKNVLNIMGSPIHLSKTVMNLVSNAVEAILERGRVLISTENRYVDRPVAGHDDIEEGNYVILKVSDTGIGISPDERERIFEPFYTKKVMGRSGSGLGMAVVWGTVKDHKGYIDVQSNEGEGATFTLYFPVTKKKLSENKSLLSMSGYRGNGESILVVDDVKEQREIASTIITELGYSVTTVSSGKEAVEYIRNHTVELLVLDMIMDPGIDGLETYERILKIRPMQKAIITSGYSETDRVKETKKFGAGQYVKKPYTIETIGLAIKNELEK